MAENWIPGPWNLIWWGNEEYPYPLSILADGDGAWIARGGTVSSEANANLIAAAPDLYEALAELRKWQAPCGADPEIDAALAAADAALKLARGEA